ncbi:Tetratricopeptide repeat protein [Tenacibaculum sp. 190524A02b]|uniref:histidine kinase n=1 Tax=Tenacibaculum vairaonense TaxID=3137860 RepID=A0ABM9PL51_9FLAO
MTSYKTFLLLTFLCCYTLVFSQKKEGKYFFSFSKKVNQLKITDKDFTKTTHSFLKKEWDSVLIYSAKFLIKNIHKDATNYTHYMRGYSFMKKKLYKETLKEYNKIPPSFPFYYKITRNLGGIALEERKYQKAIFFFEKLNNLPDSVTDYNKSSVIHDLGISYFHLSNFKESEKYLSKAILLQEQAKDTLRLIGSYMDLANVYYEQYKDNIAIPYFEKAYQLSKKVTDYKIKRKASLNMAVVEENRKNFAKALKYRKEFEKWKDSLNNQYKIWSVAQFEKKLAITQKQKQIDLLATENKLKASQQKGLLTTLFLLLLLLILGIYFYFQKSKSHKIITSQKEKLNTLNQTKDKLFSIVSHDLRSSVNLLKISNKQLLSEIENRNYTVLDTLVTKNASIANNTYNLLENLLNWATMQTRQLYFHIESIDLYSVMQQVAFNYKPLLESKNLVLKNTIPPASFILADLDSLKIIIRNILDNAIKFSKPNTPIVTHIEDIDKTIYLTIEDNGIGMSSETVKELLKETDLLTKKKNKEEIGTGLGIQLCKSFAAKNLASFTIKSKKGIGTKIIIGFKKPNTHG